MGTTSLGSRFALGAMLLLFTAAPLAASATIVRDDTIVGTTTHDFEATAFGVYSTLSLPGATYGERFAGQVLSTDASGFFDTLTGTPSSPLTLLAGAPGFSLALSGSGVSEVPGRFLSGCGPLAPGCPGTFSVGEGAVSLLFGEDQQVFGFEVFAEGGEFMELGVQFFSRTGVALGAFSIPATAGVNFLGFRVAGGDGIAGVSLTNTDGGGVGYDSVTFSTIPEPSTASLVLLGLAGMGLFKRAAAEASRS
jgi:hypothetical protein